MENEVKTITSSQEPEFKLGEKLDEPAMLLYAIIFIHLCSFCADSMCQECVTFSSK